MRPFFKNVQDIDGFGEGGEVQHTMIGASSKSNLLNTPSNDRHGLPIVWLEVNLNQPKLKPGHLSSSLRKRLQVSERGAKPDDRLQESPVNI